MATVEASNGLGSVRRVRKTVTLLSQLKALVMGDAFCAGRRLYCSLLLRLVSSSISGENILPP